MAAVKFSPSDPIAAALAEDLGPSGEDVTTTFFVAPDARAEGVIAARQECVLAGIETARDTFLRVDPALDIALERSDGDRLRPGDVALRVRGRAASILTGERVALNFVQRLSGVATLTARFVDAVTGTGVRLLDTRKTTPGLRALEKAAVVAGGGTNHRLGLHDMALVKDNHLAAAHGSGIEWLRESIARLRRERPGTRVELEADTLEQVAAFLTLDGVDFILLDNMKPGQLRAAVALREQLGMTGRVQLEASGGVNLSTIRAIAETGVECISVGALTHSAVAVDFGLDFLPAEKI